MSLKSSPISRQELRAIANSFRKALGLEQVIMFPIVQVLEVLHQIIKDDDFFFECVQDDYFERGIHACYYPNENCIRINENVYLSACNGNGRDRMTIAHEIAHLLLFRVCGMQFSRCFGTQKVEAFQDPEWQAKCLAAEIMIPSHLVRDMDAHVIADKCGVSKQSAYYQKSKYK